MVQEKPLAMNDQEGLCLSFAKDSGQLCDLHIFGWELEIEVMAPCPL